MKALLFLIFLSPFALQAQNKKPLTHDVYDGWKSVGAKNISNDGKYFSYEINPQEGDGELLIQNFSGTYSLKIPRGYNATITEDSRYAIFKIKPTYKETRDAKIKKKKPEEMPKDSLGMVKLGEDSVWKDARVKSFSTPEKGSGWVAVQMEKALPDSAKKKAKPDSLQLRIDSLMRLTDSLIRKSLDSVKGNVSREELIKATQKTIKQIYKEAKDDQQETDAVIAEGDDPKKDMSGDLHVKNLDKNTTRVFKNVNEFLFDKPGNNLLIETAKNDKDSTSKAYVLLYHLQSLKLDTLLRGFNEAKNYSFDEAGKQLAFVVEKDSSAKSLQKFYKLWYYTQGADSARIIIDRNTSGIKAGECVSDNAKLNFSKDGNKLFFGTAPIPAVKDTNLVDFELARLDVWHYNDDYLQPQQLKQLAKEQKRSYDAVYFPATGNMLQLGAKDAENIQLVDEGNADWVLAETTSGNRVALQWEGRIKSSADVISLNTGERKKILYNSYGSFRASPKGKFVYWYDPVQKNYFTYNVSSGVIRNITATIKEPLYDTENDVPDFPGAAGNPTWLEADEAILINDVYDIWKVDPAGIKTPINLTQGFGKKNKTEFKYVKTDDEKRFINNGETILLGAQNKANKYGGFFTKKVDDNTMPQQLVFGPHSYSSLTKAKNNNAYLLQESSIASSELYKSADMNNLDKLTDIAAQQEPYNWLTAELFSWKMYDGKMSEGILYKPMDFDPRKKYPVIFYFYEKNADGLFNYKAPSPSASTINIPWFVSNGYIVFDPNIYYKDGEPGESAYNSVVSAAKTLGKFSWIDSTRMAIQGQSWGGYQVAYLVTRTNIFRAAGAGAPVANMTSAYGGIRWGTGLNRQFQYEKTQSRIGATLWQRPDLYIKNSPVFAADKITTPLLIMHNDADGSVPWYQGIELFTALRRLNKKAWLLEYNDEDHNLVQRKNRKDLSVRLGQFFDYYLKDTKPANWIKYGVPATDKGRDWGLEIE